MQFGDFGFGTLVGAFISGAIAIFLDQRKRKDTKRDRFLEERERAYKTFLHFSDLLFHDMMIMAQFIPALERLESGNVDPVAAKQAKQLVARIEPNLARYEGQMFSALTELSLHGPRSTGEPASRISQIVKRLTEYADNGQLDKLPELEAEYKKARDEFGVAARLDLRVNV